MQTFKSEDMKPKAQTPEEKAALLTGCADEVALLNVIKANVDGSKVTSKVHEDGKISMSFKVDGNSVLICTDSEQRNCAIAAIVMSELGVKFDRAEVQVK